MIKPALIVFLKFPEKGKVKTRLSRDLDEGFVLELYKAFVSDLVDKLEPVHNKLFFVWPPMEEPADPFERNPGQTENNRDLSEKRKDLEKLVGPGAELYSQKGKDIGEKMAHAFETVFSEGFDSAVLIGTDIPEICCDLIFDAFKMLERRDAVIGPSTDDGYYLIGFKNSEFARPVFDKIEWSTPKVLSQTLARMKHQKTNCGFLPQLNDIDTLDDLKALAKRHENENKIGSHTLKMLEQL